MKPIRITAFLETPIALMDDWTPSIDALLMYLILDANGLASPNPSDDDVHRNMELVKQEMPIELGTISDEWYWKVSSPHYEYYLEFRDAYRGRWDKQEQHLDWHGKRAKWSSSEGQTKNKTLLFQYRVTSRIDWFAVGDKQRVMALLSHCCTLGKKDRGQVKWNVQEITEDWHLIGHQKQLMRPMPAQLMANYPVMPMAFKLLNWGWKPPTWMQQNKTWCMMPSLNAVRIG